VYDKESSQIILEAHEESDCCDRTCCAPQHNAVLNFMDVRPGVPAGTVAFQAHKPFKFFNLFSCCDCCRGEMVTALPDGTKLGTVREAKCAGCAPELEVMDRNDAHFATATGPSGCFGGLMDCCVESVFSLKNPQTNQPFGQIVKKKPAGISERLASLISTGDVFTLEVPADVDLERRANLLAGVLLVDYMFFEGELLSAPLSNDAQTDGQP